MRTAICFVTDAKGFELTEHAAAIAALTQETVRDIVVFCVDFSPENKNDLINLGNNFGKNINYRTISRDGVKASSNVTSTHVTGAANMKLTALNELSSDYERSLYIDSDIILVKNIDLEKINFRGRPIAAVYDIAKVGDIPNETFHRRCEETGRSPHYFNSGFIAVNYEHWDSDCLRLFNVEFERHRLSCDYSVNCGLQDQCVMNLVFEKNWARLPLTFNLQGCAIFSERWTQAAVRHYVGKGKFIPLKFLYNDSVDVGLINRARAALGREGLGSAAPDWMIHLNRFRHRRYKKIIDNAITSVEMMFAEDFDEPGTAPRHGGGTP